MKSAMKKNVAKANVYREASDLQSSGGVVVLWHGKVQGWMNELRSPENWRPGCIAIDVDGSCWKSVGGNDQDGAERWEQI